MRIKSLVVLVLFLKSVTLQDNNETSCNKTCAQMVNIQIEPSTCTCYNGHYSPPSLWENVDKVSRSEFPLKIHMTPVKVNKQVISTAINFTFLINDDDVKGFAFRLTNSCYSSEIPATLFGRYFDWSKTDTSFKNVTLYNDELYFLPRYFNVECEIEIVALLKQSSKANPILTLSFVVLQPENISDDLCHWKSLITVDNNSYDMKKKTLNVTFATAPSRFGVKNYRMLLMDKTNSDTVWSTYINAENSPDITAVVHNVEANTSRFVSLFLETESPCSRDCCTPSNSSLFKMIILESWETKNFTTIIAVVCVLVILAVLALSAYFLFPKYVKLIKSSEKYGDSKAKVFLIYSHDILEHSKAVLHFAEYLRDYCNCEVLIDEWGVPNKDPFLWVDDCLKQADYVVIIWSRGALENNSSNNRAYNGEDLFGNCIAKSTIHINKLLSKSIFNYFRVKTFVNLYFPYVPKLKLPSPFCYLPKFYVPNDFNSFLCHIHQVDSSFSNIACRCFYPHLPYSDLVDNPLAQNLMAAINEMEEVENSGNWKNEYTLDNIVCRQYPPSSSNLGASELLISEAKETSNDWSQNNGNLNLDNETESALPVPLYPPNVDHLPIFGEQLQEARQYETQSESDDSSDSLSGLPDEIFPK